jgi:esterase/lipase superfamily enzyme
VAVAMLNFILMATALHSMLMISEREDFWHSSHFSHTQHWAEVNAHGIEGKVFTSEEIENSLHELQDKKVLILIHGFDDNKNSAIKEYFKIARNMFMWTKDPANPSDPIYDVIIGYVWPGYSHYADFYHAKKHTEVGAPRLKKLIQDISPLAKELDVLAHSMGNRLLLEALDFSEGPRMDPLVNTFYSIAPAINEHGIDNHNHYHKATENMGEMIVFYSKNDPVEKYAYPLFLHHTALGHKGDKSPALPKNVQMVNCSHLVHSHGGYFKKKSVYRLIKQKKDGLIEGPLSIQELLLHKDGTISVTKYRKH